MSESDLLSVGEFAKLLRTTKATLHHYDSLNILKPAFVSESGYRFYNRDQAQTYLIVLMFTSCGLSLKQVEGYLNTFDREHGLKLVQESETVLNEKIKRLSQLSSLMASKRQWYEVAREGGIWEPFIKTLPDEPYFSVSNTSTPGDMQSKKMHTVHSINIINYVMQYGEFPMYPFMSKLPFEEDANGKIQFTKTEGTVLEDDEVRLHIRPRGQYLCVSCEGIRHFHEKPAKVLSLYAKEKGYQLEPCIYALDPVNWVITKDESEYITLFMARIKSGYTPPEDAE